MNEIKERSSYWDNLKGFLILLTVFAHVLFQHRHISGWINGTVDIIYMFHMPAFVFISGYFGKSERSRSFFGIARLIFLYFIFNSIMGFIYGFNDLLMPVYSYWYLAALVIWRLTAHHIAGIGDIELILLAVSVFAGFYPSIDNTFAIARIIGFYPYYMLGYKMSGEKSKALYGKKYSVRAAKGLLVLAAAAAAAFAARDFFGYSNGALQMESYDTPKDAFGRIVLYIIALAFIYALRCLSPDKRLPLITSWGRNSLWIFVIHRPLTLIVSDIVYGKGTGVIFAAAVLSSVLICLITGNDLIAEYMNKFADSGAAIFSSENKEKKKFDPARAAALCVALGFVASVVISSYSGVISTDADDAVNADTDTDSTLYPVMSDEQKSLFDNAFRLTFSGDLILLEDQVKRAYNGSGYDFSDMFEYAEKYISSADYAVGVFEGPTAGEEAGYSNGNFDDGKPLYLNFPDEFASAVKDAGFDLVTTANNHLMDRGEAGALRTLDVLDSIGLDHIGSYRSAEEKQNSRIKLVDCGGIKIAFLSYTYGCNYVGDDELTEGRYSYLTSVIHGTEGKEFEKLKAAVELDLAEAKALGPDLIAVLPHIGTQFSNEPDEEQEVWFDIFKANGADIILGDHPHAAEPVTIEQYDGRTVYTAYCPGNFANIYRENQGDTSMLADVYISRDTKEIIGGSVVPLYTQSPADGNYRALPIYEIMNNGELRSSLSTDDISRAAKANGIITEVVFGHKTDITSVTERYYFDENGFIRSKTEGLALTDEMKSGLLFTALEDADTVCFVGDSVTEGTRNGGCPWYEPIEQYIDGSVYNYSKGGCTASFITEHAEDIPEAQLYVIAVGTNDVRYRDDSVCAMTAEAYTEELGRLTEKLSERNVGAKFIFIAPWYSTDGDPYCTLSYEQKLSLNNEYSEALEKFCSENSCGFINANGYIRNVLLHAPQSDYLLDHIHPNASAGVIMYSEAVLSAA